MTFGQARLKIGDKVVLPATDVSIKIGADPHFEKLSLSVVTEKHGEITFYICNCKSCYDSIIKIFDIK